MATVETSRQDDIAVVAFANPPVNALSQAVRAGLAEAFAAANADAGVRAIVLTAKGRAFSAGADITEFKAPSKEPRLPALIDSIEASAKPVVAAINGLALGGGLEMVLGCHYRVAGKNVSQLGLPEVKIGIVPGAGGTQRLPRAVGVEAALDMIVSGTPIDAARAHALGLVDRLAEGDVVATAVAYAKELLAAGKGPSRTSERTIDPAKVPAGIFDAKRKTLGRHPSGPLAPRNCIEAVAAATTLPFREGVAKERALFDECAASPYAKALQYAFFAERQTQNIPGLDAGITPRTVNRVGIIGAGTMGSGIALAFLNAGIPVTLVETQRAALDRGTKHIRATIESAVQRGRIAADEGKKRLAALTSSLDLQDLADVDLAIEAVFED
ncbi:MAG: enoyl-CoA hydratase-related protein, partial [Hyphomicrobiaceae bacterium]